MSDPQWVDVYWSDLIGRCRSVRVAAAAAARGVRLRRSLVAAGFSRSRPRTGDVLLVPDWDSARPNPWDGHAQVVLGNLMGSDGRPDASCSRSALRAVLGRAAADGLEIQAAAELEFYLIDSATRRPIYDEINQYSLTKGAELEFLLQDLRERLAVLGVPVEAMNPEYSGGQTEINIKYTEALAAADRAVLARHFIREMARSHGLDATFMAKPWTEQAGNGLHVHQSVWRAPAGQAETGGGANLFHSAGGLSTDGNATSPAWSATCASWSCWARPPRMPTTAGPTSRSRRPGSAGASTTARSPCGRSPAARDRRASSSATPLPTAMSISPSPGSSRPGSTGSSAPLDTARPVTGNAYARTDLPTACPNPFPRRSISWPQATWPARRSDQSPTLLLEVLRPERTVLITSTADWERDRYMSVV